MTYTITDPRYNANGTIDVIWDHPRHGPIPFTAVDPSTGDWPGEPEYMQEIWDGLMRGDYGTIAPQEAE